MLEQLKLMRKKEKGKAMYVCLTEGNNNLDLCSVSGVVAVFVQDDLWMRVWLLL